MIRQSYRAEIIQIPRQVKPQYLQNQRTVDWVRTLLLAGLRSAMLWQQLGGGRFELMFGRKTIIREARAFLLG